MSAPDQNDLLLNRQLPDDPFGAAERVTVPAVLPPATTTSTTSQSEPDAPEETSITAHFQDAGAFLADQQNAKVEFLVEGLLPARDLALAGGQPDCWKSWVTLNLGLCVAVGEPFLGIYEIRSPGRVALVCEDDPPSELDRRIQALMRGMKHDPKELDGRFKILCRQGLRLDDPKHIAEVAEYVKQNDIRLLILDPLARMHCCDENEARSIKPVVEALRGLSRLATVLLVAHYRKNERGKNSRPGQLVRGSGDLWAASRTVFGFERKGNTVLLSPSCHYLAHSDPLKLLVIDEQQDANTKLTRFTIARSTTAAGQPDSDSLEGQILDAIRTGGNLTQTEVRERVKGANGKIDAALKSLEAAGLLTVGEGQRQDKKGRSRRPKVYCFAGNLAQPAMPDNDSEPEEDEGDGEDF